MLLSEERITELIAEYPTYSDKWLLARAIEHETAEACAKICEAERTDAVGRRTSAKYYAAVIREAAK